MIVANSLCFLILQIVVLDGGVVAESGSHNELLGKGGKYAEMWERQASVDDFAHPIESR